ncbi:fimbrial biogenesis outer membrane usher protein (plasmid) [Enterobacter kobei]|nr:fimbria/pilus outer membrane usher protein [Enterobacter kobei]UOY68662.1 fimbrial biogenesis outer membrane usher protein [Enterobacter kobei]
MEFDASFLNVEDKKLLDLSRFSKGSSGTPGTYKTALYVNNQLISNRDIEFRQRENKAVYPCLTQDIIKNIAFNFDKLPSEFLKASEANCMDLTHELKDAQVNYDSNEQRLDIEIPQVYMQNLARGSVSSELWDSGVTAALLGYSVNAYNSESHRNTNNSLFAGINAGLNVGAWYLRHNGSYTQTDSSSKHYSSINTYLQRDVPLLGATALVGQSNTTGTLFDTLPFTGAQLATDERMLPESLRGYAPEIRGLARTNARVTIYQGEQVLYETTVTPGEFLINDLYPTGYGGDLLVTVHESDGSQQNFIVPYAAVPQLLRPGSSRYSVTAGELRSDNLRDNPALYQGTYQYGLTNALTGYGGLQMSEHYYALQLGGAVGTSIGALSFDVTQSYAQLGNAATSQAEKQSSSSFSGQSYKMSYSKLIIETKSNFSLAAYRYSTSGYMDFMTAMQTRNALAEGYSADAIWRAKNRMTMTFGQGLPEGWGQLSMSGAMQDYWNKDGKDTQYQVGYNNSYKKLSFGLTASRTFSSLSQSQTNYLLSFSLPLGRDDQVSTPQLRTDLTHDTTGRTAQQLALSGTAGEESQFSYGATAMHGNQGTGSSGSLNGSYLSPVTSVNASVGSGKNYRSASVGMNGSAIAHSGGVTFTPYASDTFALVEAKGAKGAKVSSYPGIRIDSNGYAVVPYLNPYQMNDVSIDPKGMPDDIELANTGQKVAPYSGAIVKVKYDTKRGTPILVNATLKNGEPVPFGADVLDSKGNTVGSVGQGGQIYARVTGESDKLLVTWAEGSMARCSLNYRLIPVAKSQQSMQQFNSVCQ